jgi:hypothetical protein
MTMLPESRSTLVLAVSCTIAMSCFNTIATAFAQNYMIEYIRNTTIAKVKTRSHLPQLTVGKEVATHL